MGGGNVRHLLVQVHVCICAGECVCFARVCVYLCKGMHVSVQVGVCVHRVLW